MEERCEACQVMGGREAPCVSKETRNEFRRLKGRPCPRVELGPAFMLEARIIAARLSEESGAWALELLRLLVPRQERALVMARVSAVLADPLVEHAREDAREQEAERRRERKGRS